MRCDVNEVDAFFFVLDKVLQYSSGFALDKLFIESLYEIDDHDDEQNSDK